MSEDPNMAVRIVGNLILAPSVTVPLYAGGDLDVSLEKAIEMGVGPGKSFTFDIEVDGLLSRHSGVVPEPLPNGGYRFTLDRRTFVRNLPERPVT